MKTEIRKISTMVEAIIKYNISLTKGDEVELSTKRIKEIKKLRFDLKRETQQRLKSDINNEIKN